MQMESYTAEKRILNQQLGRQRVNRVDACFSSLDQLGRWQDSCGDTDMRICLRFYIHLSVRPFAFSSLWPRSAKQHQVDFVFLHRIYEGRPRATRGHGGGREAEVEIQIFVRWDLSDLKF